MVCTKASPLIAVWIFFGSCAVTALISFFIKEELSISNKSKVRDLEKVEVEKFLIGGVMDHSNSQDKTQIASN